MGEPVPTPFDKLREWFELELKTDEEREKAIAELEKWLSKIKSNRMGRTN